MARTWRPADLAPAAVVLALLVGLVEIRMDAPWASGVLLLVAAVPAAIVLAAALAADGDEDEDERAAQTVLLVAGLVLAGIAIARLGQALADDGFEGGTPTWMLALFTALAAYCHHRTRSVACLLIGSLAAVALLLAAVAWIFDTSDPDVFRALLTLSFVALFAAGVAAGGREGTILVGAAGVTVIATAYALGFFFAFAPGGPSLGWGWELVTLIEGAALLAYAVARLEPGPAYLGFFTLAIFVSTAAISGQGLIQLEGESEPEHSLVGWPLALAVLTVAAVAWGVRGAQRR